MCNSGVGSKLTQRRNSNSLAKIQATNPKRIMSITWMEKNLSQKMAMKLRSWSVHSR